MPRRRKALEIKPKKFKFRIKGELFEEYRKRYGMSLLQAYDLTGVQPGTIGRIEKNETPDPQISSFLPLLELLLDDPKSGVQGIYDFIEKTGVNDGDGGFKVDPKSSGRKPTQQKKQRTRRIPGSSRE